MAAVSSSLTVVCFYLVAQMVGAGQLIKLLFGLDYNVALFVVGALMMVYVTFGGMVATTWVQIIKACMLLAGGTLVMVLAMSQFGFSFENLMGGAEPSRCIRHGREAAVPGLPAADPVTALSLGLGLMFGTAGLPAHPDALLHRDQRQGSPQVGALRLRFRGLLLQRDPADGLRGHHHRRPEPEFFEGGKIGGKIVGGGNMVAMHLAKAVGGNLLLGFLSAVAFATILAVVSGLALAGAAAISHDIYARVIRKGKATETEELRVSRFASVPGPGGHRPRHRLREDERGVHGGPGLRHRRLRQLPGADLSMYWKGLTTRGADCGRLRRPGGCGAAGAAVQVRVGDRAGQRPGDLPVRPAGPVLHAAGLPGDLHRVQARQQRRGPGRTRRFRPSTSVPRPVSALPASH